jgi:tagatose-1,6-bisphosphate aldolase
MTAWSHLEPADALRRARTLDQLAGPDGVVCGAAADHRDALRAVLERRGLLLGDADVGALKARVAAALAPAATMILLDVELGAPAAVAAGALPGTTALVVPLELGGYGDVARVQETSLMPGWSPAAARAAGAAACKLLLPYRVDVPEQAARQEAVVARCAAACRAAGTVLVLEPIVYARDGETHAPGRFAELVVEGARRLAALDPGLLKLQYPGSADACRQLDAACGRATPWVLLGGGAGEEDVVAQLRDAGAAGASGFIVGRTLWADALVEDPAAQAAALAEHARPRLERLAAIAREVAVPWRRRVGPLEQPPPDPFGATAG